MNKLSVQKGIISPVLIIGGVIILTIIFFIATGSFKFNVSTNPQPSQKEDQTTESKAPESKSYQSSQYGFTLQYPGNWSVKESQGQYAAAFLSPEESSSDPYREFVGVKIVNLSSQPNIGLQEAADLWEEQTVAESSDSNFQVVDRQSTTIAGLEARDIVYTADIENIPAKGFVRISLANDYIYIFQYFAETDKYNQYLPDIESILSSVNF